MKNTIGSLIEIALNLSIALGSIFIFTIPIVPVQEHGIFLHFKPRNTYRLKVRGWKKIFHANEDEKKAEVAILISDKIYFKIKNIIREKERHYMMIKESIQEEDIAIINSVHLT